MESDVVLNKIEIMERCLSRINEEYNGDFDRIVANITKQDSVILNLERLCQASIDLGMHLVRTQGLGLPKESRECFLKLENAGFIKPTTALKLAKMVGFRNIAIHDYQKLNLVVVRSIVENELGIFIQFRDELMLLLKTNQQQSEG